MPVLGIGAPGGVVLGVALAPWLAVVTARAGDTGRDARFELLELQLQLFHAGHLPSSRYIPDLAPMRSLAAVAARVRARHPRHAHRRWIPGGYHHDQNSSLMYLW